MLKVRPVTAATPIPSPQDLRLRAVLATCPANQVVIGEHVEVVSVDEGYQATVPAAVAHEQSITVIVVTKPKGSHAVVLLIKR